jgi:flagellar biosynthesis/type III secretory pathway chaperone
MLATLLQEERAAVESLAQQLRYEYAVLKTRDAPGLEQIVREKLASADHLRTLIASRLGYLRNQGFAANPQGLAACIADAPSDEQALLSTLMADLESAAAQARHQNEVNGSIIAASRSYVERALVILSGRDPLDFLYDQETRKVFGNGSLPIAKV